MEKRIFISYKRVDLPKILKIKDKIEEAVPTRCWMDVEGIESDAQFEDVIIDSIDLCEIFLFMYSSSHLSIKNKEKDWTLKELRYAENRGKRIVFINLDNTPLTKNLLFNYDSKQQVDATDPERMDKLILDIRRWLNIKEHKSSEAGIQENKDSSYPPFIRIPWNRKSLVMVLSDNEEYYLGNLNADEGDFSWWKNKWVSSIGIFLLSNSALLTVGAMVFRDFFKKNFSTSASACKELSAQTGYKFDIPTEDELSKVRKTERKHCVILRIKDNPDLPKK